MSAGEEVSHARQPMIRGKLTFGDVEQIKELKRFHEMSAGPCDDSCEICAGDAI